MFEEQKEIRTNQKNEEVILYCFLGIFVIYVLDSFVYIGKYKRLPTHIEREGYFFTDLKIGEELYEQYYSSSMEKE